MRQSVEWSCVPREERDPLAMLSLFGEPFSFLRTRRLRGVLAVYRPFWAKKPPDISQFPGGETRGFLSIFATYTYFSKTDSSFFGAADTGVYAAVSSNPERTSCRSSINRLAARAGGNDVGTDL